MKIQRILRATRMEGEKYQIVLAFTSGEEFVTWDYCEDTKYTYGHYYTNFTDALNDFRERAASAFGEDWYITYCARQIGQEEIVWEELDEPTEEAEPKSDPVSRS